MNEMIDNGFKAWWEKSSIMDISYRNGETHPQREKRIAELAWDKGIKHAECGNSDERLRMAYMQNAAQQMMGLQNAYPMYGLGQSVGAAGAMTSGCALGGMVGGIYQQERPVKPSLLVRYHRWQADRLESVLNVQSAKCYLLRKSEREYGNSYYTDLLRHSEIECVQIESKLEYHKARSEVKP